MPRQCWLCAEWSEALILTADPYDGEAIQVCPTCFDTLVDIRSGLADESDVQTLRELYGHDDQVDGHDE